MNIASDPEGVRACPCCTEKRSRLLELGVELTAVECRPEETTRPRSDPESLGKLARKIFLAAVPALAVPSCADHTPGNMPSFGLDNGTVSKMDVPDGPSLDEAA